MTAGVFITGTNTGVGKTLVAALLMSAAHAQGIHLRYFKPIQTGSECDCATVKTLTAVTDEDIIKPLFSFQAPQAPYRAALAENRRIDIDTIVQYTQNHPMPYLLEGAGGLLVPLTEKYLIRDLIKALDLPTIIVASTQLGTINHTLLTVEAALRAKITIAGVVLSGPIDVGLSATLKQFLSVPVLAEIPILEHKAMQNFLECATTIFHSNLLQRIFA